MIKAIPQELTALVAKLLRDMPRNPDIIALSQQFNAWIAEQATWKHNLYRHYDAHGVLLYVGISINAINRLGQHKTNSAWFGSIQRVEIEKFKTVDEARDAERHAICTEKPRHNVQYNDPPSSNGLESNAVRPPFDKRAYQRDLMRKRRADEKRRRQQESITAEK